MVTIEIPASIVEVLKEMERTKPLEQKFRELIIREVEGRILRYEMMIEFFESKYGMGFKDFDERGIVEKLGHTWDVERDYFDWEMAVTELEYLKEALRRLTSN
ncbi:MAG: hypothetical protein AOA65_1436 [Candidatus Bathyarchaeota archaeon BA1]|nr:MAG: hypothetical protein AOA65_1436 [Candidatus Bathyarchaeota archaeon BA1]